VRNLTPTSAFWFEKCPDPALLVASLRKTLGIFPIVAGRLRPAAAGNADGSLFEVALSDEGVLFDVFSCSGGVGDFTTGQGEAHLQPLGNFTPARFNAAIDTRAMLRGKAPLGRIRLTRLADGGGVIGMTFSHTVVGALRPGGG
jgi:hypothetical protein